MCVSVCLFFWGGLRHPAAILSAAAVGCHLATSQAMWRRSKRPLKLPSTWLDHQHRSEMRAHSRLGGLSHSTILNSCLLMLRSISLFRSVQDDDFAAGVDPRLAWVRATDQGRGMRKVEWGMRCGRGDVKRGREKWITCQKLSQSLIFRFFGHHCLQSFCSIRACFSQPQYGRYPSNAFQFFWMFPYD